MELHDLHGIPRMKEKLGRDRCLTFNLLRSKPFSTLRWLNELDGRSMCNTWSSGRTVLLRIIHGLMPGKLSTQVFQSRSSWTRVMIYFCPGSLMQEHPARAPWPGVSLCQGGELYQHIGFLYVQFVKVGCRTLFLFLISVLVKGSLVS